MAGISDKAIKSPYAENKYRANGGNELQNKEFGDGSGLEAYDANFRMYDPQIGRFWQIDPLAIVTADWSPYAYALDNPTLFNDPLGLLSDSSHPQELGAAYVTPGSGQHCCSLANTSGGDPNVTADAAPESTAALPINDPKSNSGKNNTASQDKGDHNIVTDIAYELNRFNPLAQLYNLGSTIFTGHDSYDQKQNIGQAAVNLAASIPIGRVGIGLDLLEQGLGNTGRIEAANLAEQLAMEEIKTNPALGARILRMKPLTDPRWKGWVKMTNNAAHGVEIHFNALFKDGVMIAVDDFKFK